MAGQKRSSKMTAITTAITTQPPEGVTEEQALAQSKGHRSMVRRRLRRERLQRLAA